MMNTVNPLKVIMRATGGFTICMLFIFSELWIIGLGVAHSASCPVDGSRAGLLFDHYLEDPVNAAGYKQITEYNGTVGIEFSKRNGQLFIEREGNGWITKTIKTTYRSTYWSCDYATVYINATVTFDSSAQVCNPNDGKVYFDITTEAPISQNNSYVCWTPDGQLYYFDDHTYDATSFPNTFMIPFEDNATHRLPYRDNGEWKWTIKIRTSNYNWPRVGPVIYDLLLTPDHGNE